MWRNNGLSIVLVALFLGCLVGHALSGWKFHNQELREHGESEISFAQFLRSSEFGETVFENWESEFLQMAFYVLLTVSLYQKGSSESKDPDKKSEVDDDPEKHRNKRNAPLPVRRGGWLLAIYKYSLALAFSLLFIGSFAGHMAAGARKYNLAQRQHGSTESLTALEYGSTSQFWYESFQNWQSEFLAVLSIVVLSIWLRQHGSPESKPVHAAHGETGTS